MDDSPFNKLSAELRNRIYVLALQHHGPITLTPKHKPSEDPYAVSRYQEIIVTKLPPNVLGITTACRQMHNESIRLFYNINSFDMSSGLHAFGDVKHMFSQFRQAIGDQNFAAMGQFEFPLALGTFGHPGDNYEVMRDLMLEQLGYLTSLINMIKVSTDAKVLMHWYCLDNDEETTIRIPNDHEYDWKQTFLFLDKELDTDFVRTKFRKKFMDDMKISDFT